MWDALTQAAQLDAFHADRDLTVPDPVGLAHRDNPGVEEKEGYVVEVLAPSLLVLRGSPDGLRGEITADGGETTRIRRRRLRPVEKLPPMRRAGTCAWMPWRRP